ncbi:hypothetical protein [Acidipropionibacterium thoenii]|uniref:hypothetical protein n=1 Tax=Acidipropionibacterium thoenii TaxID=1751 RepID=UPI0004830EA8|nr:hypothetical protein [Acidipropionibacterium thoenii]
MIRTIRPTAYSKLVGAMFDLTIAALLFGCFADADSAPQQAAFIAGSLLFLLAGLKLAFNGRVQVDRETRTVKVTRRLWGHQIIRFSDIVGIGLCDSTFVIGRWGEGALAVTLAVKGQDSGKLRAIKCYGLCSFTATDAIHVRMLELRDAIGEWEHTPRLDWFAGSPITEDMIDD